MKTGQKRVILGCFWGRNGFFLMTCGRTRFFEGRDQGSEIRGQGSGRESLLPPIADWVRGTSVNTGRQEDQS